jgi:low temperature requirement protein LtrA
VTNERPSTTRVEPGPVTAVEVFFDIVFVFTLTQLTRTLESDLSLANAGRVLLLFGILWWMYGGYAWLTNHVPPRKPSQKLFLFAAMSGFLIAAVGIPHAFGETGILFGVGYLVVILVHVLVFAQSDALAGVVRFAPYNLASALLVLGTSSVDGSARLAAWVGAFFLMVLVPYLVPKRYSWIGAAQSFHISAPHFVERHGLLVMIALGESVIAIGMGVDVGHPSLLGVTMIALALLLPGTLWWTYFTDAERAEHALAAAEVGERTKLAIAAYFFAHIPILLGIVATAAGIHAAIAHPAQASDWPSAIALSGGVALFLMGIAEVRRCLKIASPASRWMVAGVILATTPLGTATSAGLHVATVVAIMVAMLVNDARRGQHHSIHDTLATD